MATVRVLSPFRIIIEDNLMESTKIVSSEGIIDNKEISKAKPLLVKQDENITNKDRWSKSFKRIAYKYMETLVKNFETVIISNVNSIE